MNPPNRAAVYRIARSGNQLGEYDIDRIVELLDSGELLWSDLGWTAGMAGWAPLTNLRAEVAAAKAFPPVASTAVPPPLANRRRPTPVPALQPASPVVAPSVAPAAGAGWGWVLGGVVLGALLGLLITAMFPSIELVDRPVEVVKTVEKVVERPVERRVEVPAALTPAQQQAIDYYARLDDAMKREVGLGGTAMLPAAGKRIKVLVNMDDLLKKTVTAQSVRARVEAVFRRNGFEVVDVSDNSQFVNTLVTAEVFRADDKSTVQVAGVIRITVAQFCFVSSANVTKRAWVDVHRYENALMFGSSNFYKFTSIFEDFAVQAANDLSKAGPLPEIR
jgi:hypothetical protein